MASVTIRKKEKAGRIAIKIERYKIIEIPRGKLHFSQLRSFNIYFVNYI